MEPHPTPTTKPPKKQKRKEPPALNDATPMLSTCSDIRDTEV